MLASENPDDASILQILWDVEYWIRSGFIQALIRTHLYNASHR